MSNIQLENIILWQRDGSIRNLEFKKNKVNVITGDPGKGKSSILFIVDYCLLSSSSKGISKTNIDSNVYWYGIRINILGTTVTIARGAIGTSGENSIYYNDHGKIPSQPIENIKMANLKGLLNRLFGIDPNLTIPYGGRNIKAGQRVSFRNFLSFCYQDQNTVTSPSYLFIKPEDERFQETIQRVYRMGLGVEDAKTSVAKSTLAQLRKKESEIEQKKASYEKNQFIFSDEIKTLAYEAEHLGLLSTQDKDVPSLFHELSEITTKAVLNGNDETSFIDLKSQLYLLKSKQKKYISFLEKTNLNNREKIEDALLPTANIVKHNIFDSNIATAVVEELHSQLLKIRNDINKNNVAPFIIELQAEIEQNNKLIEEIEDKILAISPIKIRNAKDFYLFIGRLEERLKRLGKQEHNDFENQLKTIKKKIKDVQSSIKTDVKYQVSEKKLNEFINQHLSKMKLKGYEGFTAFYNEKERVINLFNELDNNFEFMPDIGSASNYMYIHLAFFMAYHHVARLNNTKWLPSFLIIDQPSSPYLSSNDKHAVDTISLNAALQELNDFVSEMNQLGGFQIILLEHIKEEDWKSLQLENFTLVDKEFRGDHGLII
ncbi:MULTISPECIES: DUF3732 domain-containing protein [Aeromonas]|uniref:DUF3732 domain-containing protein n=1 Tax=Aeromonas TaxID=642 RepID=UPI000579F141|nr:DUF3732 domain-containing protein [Aeromonas caviae]